MKRKFLINPSANKGKVNLFSNNLISYFQKLFGTCDYELTQSAEDLTLMTRQAIYNGAEQIIAVGGDGTIHYVVNGFFENNSLINPAARLAISDSGSGSDFFRNLIYNSNTHGKNIRWEDLVENHSVKLIDLGSIVLNNEPAFKRYFLNSASLGMSTGVVGSQKQLPKWIPSSLSYSLPAAKALLNYKPLVFSGIVDGKKFKDEFLNIFIAKGRFAGAGMILGNNIQNNDGNFSITLIKELSILKRLQKFAFIRSEGLTADTYVQKITSNTLTLISPLPEELECDGELLSLRDVKRVDFNVESQLLRLCVPI